MTEDVKIGFFRKVVISIKDIDKYDQLAVQPIRKTVGYFLKLMFLFGLILAIVYAVQISQVINKAKIEINNIPDFKYNKGQISFKDNDKSIMIENVSNLLNTVLILPEGENENSKEDVAKAKTYNSYLILSKSDFTISVNDSRLNFKYDDILKNYSIKSFDKTELKQYLDEMNTIALSVSFLFVMSIYLFIWYAIAVGLDICITFLISFITTRLARIRLKNSALINIAIHSLTLSIVLYLIYGIANMLTGFEISNFRTMYVGVASIYAVISILIIKADFIEKQKELAKVIKEQEAIRKEMQEQEENEYNKPKEQTEQTKEEPKEPEQQQNDGKEQENNSQSVGEFESIQEKQEDKPI